LYNRLNAAFLNDSHKRKTSLNALVETEIQIADENLVPPESSSLFKSSPSAQDLASKEIDRLIRKAAEYKELAPLLSKEQLEKKIKKIEEQNKLSASPLGYSDLEKKQQEVEIDLLRNQSSRAGNLLTLLQSIQEKVEHKDVKRDIEEIQTLKQ